MNHRTLDLLCAAVSALWLGGSSAALTHEDRTPGPVAAASAGEATARHHDDESSIAGRPGKPDGINRVIIVKAQDSMRLEPDAFSFAVGDTVRFVVTNAGSIRHEFVLGDASEIGEHRDMMRRMPEMVHDDANAMTLEPGATKELLWKFDHAGRFEIGCLQPGHYEAGMRATVAVR